MALVTPQMRVLSIEDDPVDAFLISSAFRRWGRGQTELCVARSLGEGLTRLEHERFAVVLLDLSLPDAVDLEGVRTLRRAAPQLPVLVFSGQDDEQLALRALQAGAFDYLLKGRVEPSQLACIVGAAVERHRLSRALASARRDELERADSFLSHVSHELRTPLAVFEQFTSILADGLAGPLSDEQQQCTDVLRRNAKQLRRMVDDLLEASRGAHGGLHLERRPVALDVIVDDTLARLAMRTRERELRLEVHVEAGLVVDADPERIDQVLANLLDNALRFTPRGGRIAIVGRASPHAERQVQLTVADSGCGIAHGELQSIFERFTQGSRQGDEPSRAGLGLGLHIGRQIVEAHGGSLWAESHRGRGSRFHLTLPLWSLEGLLEPLVRRRHGFDEPIVEVRVALEATDDGAAGRERQALLEALVRRAAGEVQGAALPSDGSSARLVLRAAGPALRVLVRRLRQRWARERAGGGLVVTRRVLHGPRPGVPAPDVRQLIRSLEEGPEAPTAQRFQAKGMNNTSTQ